MELALAERLEAFAARMLRPRMAINFEARLDEGISSSYPPIFVYMENPHSNNK